MHKLFGSKKQNSLFIIADLGLTCGGDLKRSFELIDTAAELGVDAVKFQMIDSGELLGDKSVEYTYPTLVRGNITENMYEMFFGLEFSDEEWVEIKNHCDQIGIGLIVTCHVESAVERVNRLDLPVNKICTWSLSHYRMIQALAKNGKPLIIDTGTIDMSELSELHAFYKDSGGGEIIIFYDFHTSDPGDMNFNAIRSLIGSGYQVGYTPQGRRDWLDYMAIGLGVNIVEKRLTLSREIPKNGHWKAHEPNEFKTWMGNAVECYRSLGEERLKPTKQDIADKEKYYKSAWLTCDVEKGELISEEHFMYKRPGTGTSSKEMHTNYIGKSFSRAFKAGEMFKA